MEKLKKGVIMKKICIFLFISLCLCGCSQTINVENEVLTRDKIEQLMNENEYVIIDVRTEEEYNEGHLVDAINIPYDIINESIDLDKENVIFVYCKSGKRSKIAYEKLTELGYEVYDLGGYASINLPKE